MSDINVANASDLLKCIRHGREMVLDFPTCFNVASIAMSPGWPESVRYLPVGARMHVFQLSHNPIFNYFTVRKWLHCCHWNSVSACCQDDQTLDVDNLPNIPLIVTWRCCLSFPWRSSIDAGLPTTGRGVWGCSTRGRPFCKVGSSSLHMPGMTEKETVNAASTCSMELWCQMALV